MNYLIRAAKPYDITEIINLCAEHALYEQANYDSTGKTEKLSKLLFCDHPSLFCLMAEHENEILGYATFSFEYSTWNADFYSHMDCLFLREKYRGNGIGEAFVNKIIELSKARKAHHLEWQTPIFNERAIKFYNRIGATSKEKLRFTLTF
ncbi:MAG: N-acetyltransferase family protein [Bacteroidia bacterium]